MTRRSSKPAKAPAPAKNPKQYEVLVPENGPSREELIADIAVNGDLANAGTTVVFSQGQLGMADITRATKTLQKSIGASKAGSTEKADELLISQAVALNAIFNELARRAAANMGEYPEAFERYMRLGLKAQSQCRSTLESLSRIKNPPNVAFVKQANIAHGHQQVNNGAQSGELVHAQESDNPPNKLMENRHGEWLDSGTTRTSRQSDPAMATVDEIDRAEK